MSEWSIIIWCNDRALMQEYALSFVSGYGQLGGHTVELVPIYPEEGCTNMGQAYRLGQTRANYPNRIYMHQDVGLQDWSVLNKLDVLLDNPQIGGVGLIGSTMDVGSGYFHSPEHTWVGEKATKDWVGIWAQTQQVKMVDGLFLATRYCLDWDTHFFGPHMLIEDACYQLRAMGLQIWTLDTQFVHRGSTFMDYTFYESLKRLRRKHHKLFPSEVPTVAELQARTHTVLDIAQEAVTSIAPTGDGFDEYIRKRIGGVLTKTGRAPKETTEKSGSSRH